MSATFPPEPPATPRPATAEWAARGERSNRVALRFIAWVALTLGRGAARMLLYPIALYYLCFAPAARRHSARYLARVLGRPPTWIERYRHFHRFAATALDRIYFVRGQLQAFDLHVEGEALIDSALAEGRGAMLLGGHLGSFEALHAVGASRPGLHVAMGMYAENARMIHEVLQAVAPDFNLGIIAIGRPGSTLAMREWLDRGGLVGLLGDRYLVNEATRLAGSQEVPFLGQPVRFTDGPLRLAMLLRRRVVFMVGLYHGGRRYEVRFEPLADFTRPVTDPAERERVLQATLRDYVARLEALVRESPFNWFNFYDYWGEDGAR